MRAEAMRRKNSPRTQSTASARQRGRTRRPAVTGPHRGHIVVGPRRMHLTLVTRAANTPRSDKPLGELLMPFRTDLALYNGNGRLTVVAEVKNRFGTSPTWAAKTRRNILAHGGQWESDFFLLVTPDRLYVWKDAGIDPIERLPTYEADTGRIFAPYFEDACIDPRQVSGQAFELVVAAWLSDLTRSSDSPKELTCDQGWLDESGFRAAVRDGRIEYEALV